MEEEEYKAFSKFSLPLPALKMEVKCRQCLQTGNSLQLTANKKRRRRTSGYTGARLEKSLHMKHRDASVTMMYQTLG